ncbi:MAG: GLPGLI family protein [Bacteroides sp.]|nr:GLPGLI family protein [Bacteroides sp.]
MMKKSLLLAAIVLMMSLPTFGQQKADVAVSYDFTYTDFRDHPKTERMTLLASPTESKFFNDLSLWVDSLQSTPDGKAKYREIIMKACVTTSPEGGMAIDLTKGPTKTVYTYIFNDLPKGTMTVYDKFGQEQGFYVEPLTEMSWKIVEDSAANVMGYECVMAESDYHGRHWKAWFTPEIPLTAGPWKLHGLPGLIMKAEADGGFSFTATGLEKTDRVMTPMYSARDYSKVDRKKALADKEYAANNAQSVLRAKFGATVTILPRKDENGNEIPENKYDGLLHSLEPDYKIGSTF